MKKLLTATGAAVFLTNMTLAPAFADSLAQPTTPRQQQQVVLPEGQMMSDAELAQVEGEWVWVAAGTGLELAFKYAECQRPGQQCGWQDYAIAGAKGAAFSLIPGGSAAKNGVRFFQNGQKINGLRVFVR
ncbi:hypothetical protein [Coleofasciculus sp. H7-2]|uniref:hypothetical protein n=1 Tax=Coleofasciculus sp. H7-2 TaxID=3351545 RepID=UPI00366C2AB6